MIEIDNITVTYKSGERQIPALSSVNLNIEDGEYLSILGPNGSGKSTLVKALCGLVGLERGSVKIDKTVILPGQFANELFGKVGVVFQEPSGQFLMPSVEREIEAVLENLGLDHSQQRQRFDDIVSKFELRGMLQISPQNLSPGQMQIVNLAVAFLAGSEILILDEPTTFLDLKYRRLFLDYIQSINKSGRTIIHVTQYPDEALLSDRACIMDSGRVISRGESGAILSDEILAQKCGLTLPRTIEFENHFGFEFDDSEKKKEFISGMGKEAPLHKTPSVENKLIISAEDISYSYSKSGFSMNIEKLHLYENSVVGLVGPSGSGKSTLALLLAGIIKPLKGNIEYHDKSYDKSGSGKFVGLSWQMPEPVLIGPTVADDLRLAVDNADEFENKSKSLLEKSGLGGFEDRIVDTLSGGEKRKLSLASVLATRPHYLILDEPAAFLDPASQEELQVLIKEILRSVKGALIIGHDLVFLSELADRIIGLQDGSIALDLPAAEFFSDPRYSLEIGLEVDPLITFRNELANSGIGLPISSLRPAALKRYLEDSYP